MTGMDKNSSNSIRENLESYSNIFCIENSLRLIIVETLEKLIGPKWFESIPPDLRDNIKEKVEYEKKINWKKIVLFNPVCYLNFPDLKKIILSFWEKAFKSIFKRKEIIESIFIKLEPIRNALAHNRPLNNEDLLDTKEAFVELRNMIGADRISMFVRNSITVNNIKTNIRSLYSMSVRIFGVINSYKEILELEYWEKIKNEWWFNSDYLGENIRHITDFFILAEEYMKIPRKRGTGHLIEKWVNISNVKEIYTYSESVFKKLLE